MKRIAFLLCTIVLLFANTAEARWRRRSNQVTYTRPVATVQVAASAAATTAQVADSAAKNDEDEEEAAADEADAAASPAVSAAANNATSTPAPAAAQTATAATARTVSYSTATAQGVANLMAASNRVGHWGGNPGYEGCGCGVTPQAAYAICCYGNSGMATVDVGYARSASGMWYCCRRYR
jgi:hypothetical protein